MTETMLDLVRCEVEWEHRQVQIAAENNREEELQAHSREYFRLRRLEDYLELRAERN